MKNACNNYHDKAELKKISNKPCQQMTRIVQAHDFHYFFES